MAGNIKLLGLFLLSPTFSFFLRVHSPLHHLHHGHHHHHGLYHHGHHDHDVHDYRAIVRHHGHFYHRPVHHHHLLPPLHRHHLHSYDHHKYHTKYHEPVYHESTSYEVPKYSSYSSDDQSYHHDLHHRADDGEDADVLVPALSGDQVEKVAQLCQHLEGVKREDEREECRLQLELDLLSFENKDLLEREIEKGGAHAKDLGNSGDSDGFQSFVTDLGSISKGSTKQKQGVKEFGNARILISMQDSSEGLEQEDTIATNDKIKDVPQAELSNIEVNMRQDSSLNQSSSDPDVLDPTLLDLLSLNSVPITDPV